MIGTWLLGIAAVSVCGSILTAITEKTASASVMKTVLALALLFMVLSPIGEWKELRFSISEETPDMTVYTDSVREKTRENTEKALSSYVETIAGKLGINCHAMVSCVLSTEGELIPDHIRIQCADDISEKQSSLKEQIMRDFGVTEDKIEYEKGL